jgi:hypothetical protein
MAWHVIKIENGNEAFEQSIIMCNNRGESQTFTITNPVCPHFQTFSLYDNMIHFLLINYASLHFFSTTT